MLRRVLLPALLLLIIPAPAGAAWGPPGELGAVSPAASNPRAAASTDGTAVITWSDAGTVYAAHKAPGKRAALGSYTVTVTATDDAGNTSTATRPVTVTAPVPAADGGDPSVPATVQPIRSAKLAKRSFKATAGKVTKTKGTTLTVDVATAGQLSSSVERAVPGWRSGKSCRAAKPKNVKQPKRCSRYKRVGELPIARLLAGKTAVPFGGAIGSKKLRSGRYRLALTAYAGAGPFARPTATAKPGRVVAFTIRKG